MRVKGKPFYGNAGRHIGRSLTGGGNRHLKIGPVRLQHPAVGGSEWFCCFVTVVRAVRTDIDAKGNGGLDLRLPGRAA